jgi:sugar-specific transcriptional regulator TrmB
MLINDLQKIGLSDKEAKIYLTLIKFQELSAGKIAKKTELPRPTVYSSLETLINKGLVSTSFVGRIKYFTVESLENLQELISQEEAGLAVKKNLLSDLQMQLQKIQQEIDRPEVTFYDGAKAVNSLMISTASKNKHLYEIGDWHVFGPYSKQFSQARLKNGNSIDLITNRTQQAEAQRKDDAKLLRKQYLISHKDFTAPALIAVGDEQLAIFTLDKDHPIGIKIRNEKIIRTIQTLFRLAIKNL